MQKIYYSETLHNVFHLLRLVAVKCSMGFNVYLTLVI
jgi:hypothetical protein